MGIDGQRLDAGEMAARRYSLSATDMYVVVEIPIGAAGGHFKVGGTQNNINLVYCCHAYNYGHEFSSTSITSREMYKYKIICTPGQILVLKRLFCFWQSHVQDGQYLTSYTIEPMLELLWTEETTHEDTRYKVLFPITTPLLSRPAQVTDSESCHHGAFDS